MKKLISLIAAGAIFAGCALISPYSIVFTTPEDSVINPTTDTLDLAVNIDSLAYISGVNCTGYDPLELLPIVTDDMEVTKAHNLSLAMLDSFEAGATCEITVTVFDKTTTANSREKITLHVLEKLEVEEEIEEVEVVAEEVTEVEDVEEIELAVCEDGTVCEAETEETTDINESNEAEATTAGEDSGTEE